MKDLGKAEKDSVSLCLCVSVFQKNRFPKGTSKEYDIYPLPPEYSSTPKPVLSDAHYLKKLRETQRRLLLFPVRLPPLPNK